MNRWAWRYTGLQLAIVGLEGVWVALASLVLSPGRAVSATLLMGVGVAALLWNRWLLAQTWWEHPLGRVGGLLGMGGMIVAAGWAAEPTLTAQAIDAPNYAARVAILLGSKSMMVAWLAAVVVIGRVILLLRTHLTLERAIGRIRTSAVLSLTALALLHGMSTRLTWLVAALVGCAMVALPLARAMELSKERGATAMPFTVRWTGTLLLGVILVLGLGLGVDAPLEARHFGLISAVLDVIRTIALYGFGFVLELLVKWVIPFFDWLVATYGDLFRSVLLPLLSLFVNRQAAESTLSQLDPRILQTFAVALVILTITLPLLALWQLYRLFHKGAEAAKNAAENEEAELAAAWYEWWKARQNDMRHLWSNLWQRKFGVDTVRDLYKNLLLFGDNHALPRPTANTPYEYLEPLCRQYPTLVGEFHALTDAYVAAKYGEHTFTEAEVRRLQNAWSRIVTYREARARQQSAPHV